MQKHEIFKVEQPLSRLCHAVKIEIGEGRMRERERETISVTFDGLS